MQKLPDGEAAAVVGRYDDLAGAEPVSHIGQRIGLGLRPVDRVGADQRRLARHPDEGQRQEVLVAAGLDELCDSGGLRAAAEDDDAPLQQPPAQSDQKCPPRQRYAGEPDQCRLQRQVGDIPEVVEPVTPVGGGDDGQGQHDDRDDEDLAEQHTKVDKAFLAVEPDRNHRGDGGDRQPRGELGGKARNPECRGRAHARLRQHVIKSGGDQQSVG